MKQRKKAKTFRTKKKKKNPQKKNRKKQAFREKKY